MFTVCTMDVEHGETFGSYEEAEKFARRMSRLIKGIVLVTEGKSWEDVSVAGFQHGEILDESVLASL